MSKASSEDNSKTILILSDFSLESVEDKIAALGHTFQKRSFEKQPCDWIEIKNDLRELNSLGKLFAVILFLSKNSILTFSTSDYIECWDNFLIECKEYSSLVFVDEVCFNNECLLNDLDEIIIHCLNFINYKLTFIKRYVGNFYRLQDVEAPIEFSSLEHVLLKLDVNEVSITYDFNHKLGMSTARLNDRDTLTMNLLRKIQSLLTELDTIINKIKGNISRRDITIDIVTLRNLIKTLESLYEQLQKDFVEKQTEQSQRANQLLKILLKSGIEIVPYKQKKEISLRVHHFLDEVDRGIILHIYVPNGRYQEDQLASLLRLFENYLQRVENLKFFIETRKTLHGQIYEFKSNNTTMNLTDMEVALSRFEQFMSLCQNDQKQAEALLLKKGIKPSEANRLLTKYLKEYQRFQLDFEHERERKMLDLRQRLESEALELTHGTSLSITQSMQTSSLFSLPNNLDPISITILNSSVIINPGLQSYVEQAIYGDIHYTTEDKELLTLFEKHADLLEAVHLRSHLEQLKDTSSPETERETAKQKIMGFLAKVAPALSQSALTVLTAYVQKILTGT